MKEIEKIQKIAIISIVIVAILVISTVAVFVNKSQSKKIASEKSSEIDINLESASTEMGKTVDESESEFEEAEVIDEETTENTVVEKDTETSAVSKKSESSSQVKKQEDLMEF